MSDAFAADLPVPRRVLVAHDFSPCADAAARAAAADLLWSVEGGTIVLAHVFEVMRIPSGLEPRNAAVGALTLERAMSTEVVRRLERLAEELRRSIEEMRREREDPPVIEVEVAVRQDTPAEGILALALEQETTRIVVGTHGRRGLSHFFLGSVAERVARISRVPVLIVKEAAA